MKKCIVLFLILVAVLVLASIFENSPEQTEPKTMTVAQIE